MDKIDQFKMHELDLSRPSVLEKGCVYIVPLLEEWRLTAQISGKANPKSTTGRLDVFTRLITDYGTESNGAGGLQGRPVSGNRAPHISASSCAKAPD